MRQPTRGWSVPSVEEYELSLADGVWRRTTDRGWSIYEIVRIDLGAFVLDSRPTVESLFPRSLRYKRASGGDWKSARIAVFGIPVTYRIDLRSVVVIVEGSLGDVIAEILVDEARQSIEEQLDARCYIIGP